MGISVDVTADGDEGRGEADELGLAAGVRMSGWERELRSSFACLSIFFCFGSNEMK